jgi:hypothetical protein
VEDACIEDILDEYALTLDDNEEIMDLSEHRNEYESDVIFVMAPF